MYTVTNFKTKKALKEAVASGKAVTVYQPNDMFNTPTPMEGTISLEGPHFPEPHRRYATATLKDGVIIKVS